MSVKITTLHVVLGLKNAVELRLHFLYTIQYIFSKTIPIAELAVPIGLFSGNRITPFRQTAYQ